LENDKPVVFGKEHDEENKDWRGSGGHGWPIFIEDGGAPTFRELKLEPRVAIQGFKDVEKRALKMTDRWRKVLEDAKALGQAGGGISVEDRGRQKKEAEKRALRSAINWWTEFLQKHNREFGPTAPPFAVHEGTQANIDLQLPFAPAAAAGASSMDISNIPTISSMQCVSEAAEDQQGPISPPSRSFVIR
jgi:hypothetical protein